MSASIVLTSNGAQSDPPVKIATDAKMDDLIEAVGTIGTPTMTGFATSANQSTEITALGTLHTDAGTTLKNAVDAVTTKLPTVGTAGSPSANVISVQGISSGTAVSVTASNSYALETTQGDVKTAVQTRSTPTTITGGLATITATGVAQALAGTASAKFVWVMAPCNTSGVATNTKPIFVGGSDIATATAPGAPVMPTNLEGFVIGISNPLTLYIMGTINEKLVYQVLN
jgi:hypothetical protein